MNLDSEGFKEWQHQISDPWAGSVNDDNSTALDTLKTTGKFTASVDALNPTEPSANPANTLSATQKMGSTFQGTQSTQFHTASSKKAATNPEVDTEVRSLIDHLQEASTGAGQESESGAAGYNTIGMSQSTHRDTDSRAAPDAPYIADRAPDLSVEGLSLDIAGDTARVPVNDLASPESTSATRATNLTVGLHRNPLPPEPEPEIRFNFHLFLEQLRHRTADPVARYLRSFLVEFGKKQWTVHEQVRIISDFLIFISGKMAQCEVWRESTDSEFDNAREGMEKLVMNRLYAQTFSPEISLSSAAAEGRGRRRAPKQSPSGRRGQHQEDVERDDVLSEKMQIFGWVEEKHLDISSAAVDGGRLLSLAQKELLKINNYRAPRDKVICILNACKVIFGLLRSSKNTDTSADSFMPLLIYTVLRAGPQHMVSNIQYIFRFRNQEKLGGEAGYYLSSLMGAVQFIETLDKTALTISDEEFERHVEASVAAIAERQPGRTSHENGGQSALLESRGDASPHTASRSPSRIESSDGAGPGAVQGLIRNIQRPLSNLGRMFSDEPSAEEPVPNRLNVDSVADHGEGSEMQATASSDEAVSAGDRATRLTQDVDVEHIVGTLSSMFPSLDREVISDIVIAKQARIGAAVDACLNMTSS